MGLFFVVVNHIMNDKTSQFTVMNNIINDIVTFLKR